MKFEIDKASFYMLTVMRGIYETRLDKVKEEKSELEDLVNKIRKEMEEKARSIASGSGSREKHRVVPVGGAHVPSRDSKKNSLHRRDGIKNNDNRL